jgi:aspartate racemase
MIAKSSFHQQFTRRHVACLAWTELPLAFPAQKTFAAFEQDGVLFVNTTAVHINATLNFAC